MLFGIGDDKIGNGPSFISGDHIVRDFSFITVRSEQ